MMEQPKPARNFREPVVVIAGGFPNFSIMKFFIKNVVI